MADIGEKKRVIEIPDPVPVPDYVPDFEPEREPAKVD